MPGPVPALCAHETESPFLPSPRGQSSDIGRQVTSGQENVCPGVGIQALEEMARLGGVVLRFSLGLRGVPHGFGGARKL